MAVGILKKLIKLILIKFDVLFIFDTSIDYSIKVEYRNSF